MAESAGFCFGVERVINIVLNNIEKNLCTYGPVIHNLSVTSDLEKKGVRIVNVLEEVLSGDTLVIRAHGVPTIIYSKLNDNNINYIDGTCPYVKKIHSYVIKSVKENRKLIIIGKGDHPEIVGIKGYADNGFYIFEDIIELKKHSFNKTSKYTLVVQTTFDKNKFEDIIEYVCGLRKELDIKVYNTICSATILRQREAEQIAKKADKMLILGDKQSSNALKLYEISKKYCKSSFFISDISEIQLNIFNNNDIVGITAGASTPSAIKKEAVKVMNELDKSLSSDADSKKDFKYMLDTSLVNIHSGDVVKGTVIQVVRGEVLVNLGYKSDGYIPRSEFSDDQYIEPEELLKPGDELEVYVINVNDGEGNVLLSKKRLDSIKNQEFIRETFENNTVCTGRIIEIIKGGAIAMINGVKVFVPKSQLSNKYSEDINSFMGQEFNFNIIEYQPHKKKIIAGRKKLAQEEEDKLKTDIYSRLKKGQKVWGKVSKVMKFGAFVDIGGVEGLIHISELSWGHVRDVSDVLKEGDDIQVIILGIDKDNNKIPLSLKNNTENPWNNISDKYHIGDIVKGKVVRLVSFGAFLEIEPGVDGLVHMSQISDKHIAKVEDVLTVGQVIDVKVININYDTKKINLSIKEN